MNEEQRQSLILIIQQFELLLGNLKDLLALGNLNSSETDRKERKYSCFDIDAIQELEKMGRKEAEEYLKNLKSKDLGNLLRKIGGSSEETKRTKDMMVQNILYKTFDFNMGHSIIKNKIDL